MSPFRFPVTILVGGVLVESSYGLSAWVSRVTSVVVNFQTVVKDVKLEHSLAMLEEVTAYPVLSSIDTVRTVPVEMLTSELL